MSDCPGNLNALHPPPPQKCFTKQLLRNNALQHQDYTPDVFFERTLVALLGIKSQQHNKQSQIENRSCYAAKQCNIKRPSCLLQSGQHVPQTSQKNKHVSPTFLARNMHSPPPNNPICKQLPHQNPTRNMFEEKTTFLHVLQICASLNGNLKSCDKDSVILVAPCHATRIWNTRLHPINFMTRAPRFAPTTNQNCNIDPRPPPQISFAERTAPSLCPPTQFLCSI